MSDTAVSMDDFLDPMQILENAKRIQEYLEKGRTLQDALNISQEKVDRQYAFAYQVLEGNSFQDAIHLFTYLAAMNPYDCRHWMGLGFSRAFANTFDEAIDAFSAAFILNPTIPDPHLYACFCYGSRGEWEEGVRALAMAQECLKEEPKLEELGLIVEEFTEKKDLALLQRHKRPRFHKGMEEWSGQVALPDALSEKGQTLLREKARELVGKSLSQKVPDRLKLFLVELRDHHKGDLLTYAFGHLG